MLPQVTILLTSVAFKTATASYLPQISYLTLIDKFVLLCMLVVLVTTLLHAVIGLLGNPTWGDATEDDITQANRFCLASTLTAWLAVQTWFLCAALRARNMDSDAGQKREKTRRHTSSALEPDETDDTRHVEVTRTESGQVTRVRIGGHASAGASFSVGASPRGKGRAARGLSGLFTRSRSKSWAVGRALERTRSAGERSVTFSNESSTKVDDEHDHEAAPAPEPV